MSPKISILSEKNSLELGESAAVFFTLSEASLDFRQTDIFIIGGRLTNFQGGGAHYSATFTATAINFYGYAKVEVGSYVFSNLAGVFNSDGQEADNLAYFDWRTSSSGGLTPAPAPAPTPSPAPSPALRSGTSSNDRLNGTTGNDEIDGEGGNDVVSGLGGDDTIEGGYGNDQLSGGEGSDFLEGEAGKDRLFGGAGADTFYFSADLFEGATRRLTSLDADVVTDFSIGTDRLYFAAFSDNSFGFDGLVPYWDGEALNQEAFFSRAGANKATSVDHRLVYDSKKGALYYDSDGVGGLGAVLVLTLTGKPPLTASDIGFEVI